MKDYKNYLSFLAIVSFLFFAVSSTEDEGSDYEEQVEAIESGSDVTENTETEVKKESAKVVEVSAKEVYKTYDENSIAGDLKYKGNVLIMKNSKILAVKQDEWKDNAIYVEVNTHSDFEYSSMNCYISKDHLEQAAMLKKGQRVTIKGLCTGYDDIYVTLEGCTIIE